MQKLHVHDASFNQTVIHVVFSVKYWIIQYIACSQSKYLPLFIEIIDITEIKIQTSCNDIFTEKMDLYYC